MSNRILFGNISNPDDFIIMSSGQPYVNVQEINGFVEDFSVEEGTLIKEFRWSRDGVSFSQWILLTLENLQANIVGSTLSKFYIEFQYTLTTTGNVGIVSTNLNVTFKVEPETSFPFPIAYPRDKGNKHWPIRMRNFSWNPYKQEAAIKLQKELSLLVNQIHGHEITYFRSIPDPKSADITFMEYTLHNVTTPECIKVVVPENTFPEHKLNINSFGIDFEMPFEVHIDKRYFEHIFGHGTRPQKRDIIYFPLTNRMYEVSSANISVQFMYDFLYWQLTLVKWQPKIDVEMSDEVEEFFDDYTTGIDEMFGTSIKKNAEDITNPTQLKDRSSKFNDIREYISPHSIHIPFEFKNNYTTVFQYYYDLNKHYIKENTPPIIYKEKCILGISDDLTYTAWIRTSINNLAYKDIFSIIKTGNSLEIKFTYGLPVIKVGDTLSIYSTSESEFGIFGEVVSIDPNRMNLTLTIEVDPSLLTIADNILTNWATSSTLKARKIIPNNLLYALDNDTGISIDLLEGRYIKYTLNDSTVWFPLVVKIQENIWYGIVLGLLNKFNQISYHIYKPRPKELKTTKLELINSQIVNGIPSEVRTSNVNYKILGSPLNISNIRLLKESLEGDLHSKFLNLQIINDASSTIIIDNCEPRTKLPYVGNPK